MKDFVVFGCGDFADIVTHLIEIDLNRIVAGYIIDDEYCKGQTEYKGKPVCPLSRAADMFSPETHSGALAVIGDLTFEVREEKFKAMLELGYEMENLIHPSAVLTSKNLGQGNIILENCVVAYGASLGDCNIMWPLSAINHHGKIGSFNNISPGVMTSGNVTAGSFCFMGCNSTYKNKITLADHTFVGAGAYISQDTEPYGVYVPARTVKIDKSPKNLKL